MYAAPTLQPESCALTLRTRAPSLGLMRRRLSIPEIFSVRPVSVQNPQRTQPLPSSEEPVAAPLDAEAAGILKRELTRLLSVEEHLRMQLQLIEGEVSSPTTNSLIEAIRDGSDSQLPEEIARVGELVREAVRILKGSEEYLRGLLDTGHEELEVEGVGNLPLRLARFLAERKDLPGFSYEITQDEVRGWIIHWKEYGSQGDVRGAGQFYERPYAWLDE